MKKFLYSPGYGAGWSSWTGDEEQGKFAAFYQPIIEAIELGQKLTTDHPAVQKFKADFEQRFGDTFYLGGISQLTVGYVEDDEYFRITEYDGSESYEVRDDIDWW